MINREAIKKLTVEYQFFLYWSAAMAVLLSWMTRPSKSSWKGEQAGKVLEQHGSVEVKPSGEFRWYPVSSEDALHPFEIVATGPSSRATLELAGGVTIELPEQTQIKILPTVLNQGTELALLSGRLDILPPRRAKNQNKHSQQGHDVLRIITNQQTLKVGQDQSGVSIIQGSHTQIQTQTPESVVIETNQRTERLSVQKEPNPVQSKPATTAAVESPKKAQNAIENSPKLLPKLIRFSIQPESGLFLQPSAKEVEFKPVKQLSTSTTKNSVGVAGKVLPLQTKPKINQETTRLSGVLALGVIKGISQTQNSIPESSLKNPAMPVPSQNPKKQQQKLIASLEAKLEADNQLQIKKTSGAVQTNSIISSDRTKPKNVVSEYTAMQPPAHFPQLLAGEKFYWSKKPFNESLDSEWLLDLDLKSLKPPLAPPWRPFLRITDGATGKSIQKPLIYKDYNVVVKLSWLQDFMPDEPEKINAKIAIGIKDPKGRKRVLGSNQVFIKGESLVSNTPSSLYVAHWTIPPKKDGSPDSSAYPISPISSIDPWILSQPIGTMHPIHVYKPDTMKILARYIDGNSFAVSELQQNPGPLMIYGMKNAEFAFAATTADADFLIKIFPDLDIDLLFEGEGKWVFNTQGTENLTTFLDKKSEVYYALQGQTFKLDKSLFKTRKGAVEFLKKFNPYFFDRKVKILKQK